MSLEGVEVVPVKLEPKWDSDDGPSEAEVEQPAFYENHVLKVELELNPVMLRPDVVYTPPALKKENKDADSDILGGSCSVVLERLCIDLKSQTYTVGLRTYRFRYNDSNEDNQTQIENNSTENQITGRACLLAAKKTQSPITNKCKAPVEEKKAKPYEKIAEHNSAEKIQEPSAASQDDLHSSTDIQETTSEKPAVGSSSGITNTLNGDTNFKCDKCSRAFDIKSDLEKHINTHLLMIASMGDKSNKIFTCKPCKCIFKTKLLLLKHEKSQHGGKYFACEECEYTTKFARSFKHHLSTHTGSKPYKCTQCSSAFASCRSLQRHLRIHTGEKPFKCSQCESAFAEHGYLLSHLKTHIGEKPFKCGECSSVFKTSNNLRSHLRTHTGEKPYKCSECSSAFTTCRSLQRHLRTHTGEKPFKCSQCESAFAERGYLRSHLKTHTGEKPFKCGQCSAVFKTSNNLRGHLRIHTGQKPYKCSHCSSAFTEGSTLRNHLRIHTGEKPYKCSQCSSAFTTCRSLQRHLSTHTASTSSSLCITKNEMSS